MSDTNRAAALAHKIECRLSIDKYNRITLDNEQSHLVVSALRAYARPTPAVSEEMVERAKECLFAAGIVDIFSVRAALEVALGTPQTVPASPPPAEVRELIDTAIESVKQPNLFAPIDLRDIRAQVIAYRAARSDAVLSALTAAGYNVCRELRAIGGDTIISENEEAPEMKHGLFARRTPIGAPPLGWTCFHCGETFTTIGAARDHFGCDQLDDPACRIKVGEEHGLVQELRQAEAEIRRLCSEEHDYQEHLAHLAPVVAGQTVGPGLIAVPVEPTEAMLDAGDETEGSRTMAHAVYRAMLSALTKETGR